MLFEQPVEVEPAQVEPHAEHETNTVGAKLTRRATPEIEV